MASSCNTGPNAVWRGPQRIIWLPLSREGQGGLLVEVTCKATLYGMSWVGNRGVGKERGTFDNPPNGWREAGKAGEKCIMQDTELCQGRGFYVRPTGVTVSVRLGRGTGGHCGKLFSPLHMDYRPQRGRLEAGRYLGCWCHYLLWLWAGRSGGVHRHKRTSLEGSRCD